MSAPLTLILGLSWLTILLGCWLGWQLLRQNGRMLLRLEELEKRLDEFEFAEPDDEPRPSTAHEALASEPSTLDQQPANHHPVTSSAANGEGERANRFTNRSLARSRLKRDGLKAGTIAPDFRLPCLDGTERSLADFRGRGLLLVFSDPHCGPCQALAPYLQKFCSERPDISVLMISRGDPKENRAKVKEHGLTFPVLLQQRWEISRLYAIFATPVAYLIDETGLILHDVAVGVDSIKVAACRITPISFSSTAR
jgi:peroxiredoxin